MPTDRVPIIYDHELNVEPLRSGKVGGQHVGSDSGLRVTHLPSGLVVEVDTGRSQVRNRNIALSMITAGLMSL